MLTSEQAKQNQEKYGFNELVEGKCDRYFCSNYDQCDSWHCSDCKGGAVAEEFKTAICTGGEGAPRRCCNSDSFQRSHYR